MHKGAVTGAVLLVMAVAGPLPAAAQNAAYQDFFFQVCGGDPVGALAQRCGETDDALGNISTDSESSLNMNQPLGNNQLALARARDRLHQGDGPGEPKNSLAEEGRLSVLVHGRGNWFKRSRGAEDRERGLDGDGGGLELGLDYRLHPQASVGALLAYDRESSRFDGAAPGVNFEPTQRSGKIDAEFITLIGFANLTPIDQSYLQLSAGLGRSRFELEREAIFQESNRTVSQTNLLARARPDGRDYWLSLGAGYDVDRGPLSFGPYLRIAYAESTLKAYSESDPLDSGLAMAVAKSDRTSFTTVLGGRASHVVNTGWGVLIPHLSLEYEREHEDDVSVAQSRFVLDQSGATYTTQGDAPDRSYFNASVGFIAVFPRGRMVFLDYREVLGYRDFDRRVITAGARLEW